MRKGFFLIVILIFLVTVLPRSSATLIVEENTPGVVGVPVILQLI